MGDVQTETQKILRDNLAHSLSRFARGGPEKALGRLAKLEIYTFANCADKMRHIYPTRQVPYMEHFANELDLVAGLQALGADVSVENGFIKARAQRLKGASERGKVRNMATWWLGDLGVGSKPQVYPV